MSDSLLDPAFARESLELARRGSFSAAMDRSCNIRGIRLLLETRRTIAALRSMAEQARKAG